MIGVSARVRSVRSGRMGCAAAHPAAITPAMPVALEGDTPIQIASENPLIVVIEIVACVRIAIRPYSRNSAFSRTLSGGLVTRAG